MWLRTCIPAPCLLICQLCNNENLAVWWSMDETSNLIPNPKCSDDGLIEPLNEGRPTNKLLVPLLSSAFSEGNKGVTLEGHLFKLSNSNTF